MNNFEEIATPFGNGELCAYQFLSFLKNALLDRL
jgi:hypothetical protein